MRGLITLFCLAPLAASASFELVMAVSSLNSKIDRYDGNTGAYLGSFGKGIMNDSVGFDINRTTGRAYASSFLNRSIQVYNYNTGDFVDEIQIPGSSAPRCVAFNNGGNLMVGTSSGIQILNPNTMSLIQTFGSGANWSGVEQAPDGSYFGVNVSNSASYILTKFNSAGTFLGSVVLPAGDPSFFAFQISFAGSTGYVSNNQVVYRFSVGVNAPVLELGYNPASLTINQAVGIGHGTRRYTAGRNAAGNLSIQAFADLGTTYVTHNSFGLSEVGSYSSLQVVAAPEPGTLALLGAGLCAMLRRRKRD